MLFEVGGKACLDKGTDPLVRGNGDVGCLTNGMRLEQVQRVGVKAVVVGFDQVDLDAGVGACGFEHAVQLLGCGHNVAGAQRARAVGARP